MRHVSTAVFTARNFVMSCLQRVNLSVICREIRNMNRFLTALSDKIALLYRPLFYFILGVLLGWIHDLDEEYIFKAAVPFAEQYILDKRKPMNGRANAVIGRIIETFSLTVPGAELITRYMGLVLPVI